MIFIFSVFFSTFSSAFSFVFLFPCVVLLILSSAFLMFMWCLLCMFALCVFTQCFSIGFFGS